MEGVTVVVSPLISLMKDQVDALEANGIAAACLNSTQGAREVRDIKVINGKNKRYIIVAINDEFPRLYQIQK